MAFLNLSLFVRILWSQSSMSKKQFLRTQDTGDSWNPVVGFEVSQFDPRNSILLSISLRTRIHLISFPSSLARRPSKIDHQLCDYDRRAKSWEGARSLIKPSSCVCDTDGSTKSARKTRWKRTGRKEEGQGKGHYHADGLSPRLRRLSLSPISFT